MLVLSRKPGEEIVIAGGIVLRVVEVRKGRVRLGIDAPRDVVIERGELVGRVPTAAGRPATTRAELEVTR